MAIFTKTRRYRKSGGLMQKLPGSSKSRHGFTLIEALVMIVLSTILIIGFRYTVQAYWEQINRSMTERHLEQYGNSIVEYVARNIINAHRIYVPPNTGALSSFTATLYDPNRGYYDIKFSANRENWVMEDNERIFREFPPKQGEGSVKSILGPNETARLVKFRIDSIRRVEPPYNNPVDFYGRLYEITLMLHYQRELKAGEIPYVRDMTFSSQVALKMHGANTQQ